MCGQLPCDKPDCTWGELYRRQCEGRMVMQMADARRVAYLEGVEKKRGKDAADLLLEDARNEWRAAKNDGNNRD